MDAEEAEAVSAAVTKVASEHTESGIAAKGPKLNEEAEGLCNPEAQLPTCPRSSPEEQPDLHPVQPVAPAQDTLETKSTLVEKENQDVKVSQVAKVDRSAIVARRSVENEVVTHESVTTRGEAMDGIDPQSTKCPLEESSLQVPQSTEDKVLSPEQRWIGVTGKKRRSQLKSSGPENRRRASSSDSPRE